MFSKHLLPVNDFLPFTSSDTYPVLSLGCNISLILPDYLWKFHVCIYIFSSSDILLLKAELHILIQFPVQEMYSTNCVLFFLCWNHYLSTNFFVLHYNLFKFLSHKMALLALQQSLFFLLQAHILYSFHIPIVIHKAWQSSIYTVTWLLTSVGIFLYLTWPSRWV